MKPIQRQLSFATLLLLAVACKEKNTQNTNLESQTHQSITKVNPTPADTATLKEILIFEDQFMGYRLQGKIDPEADNLKEVMHETGEGDFFAYVLMNKEGEEIAYIYPEESNYTIVDVIYVVSPDYKTDKGIGVGNTFADLKNTYPTIETHGSEIEGRTYSNIGNLHFQLDVYLSSYEIDESKIADSTKITKVVIW